MQPKVTVMSSGIDPETIASFKDRFGQETLLLYSTGNAQHICRWTVTLCRFIVVAAFTWLGWDALIHLDVEVGLRY